LPHWLSLCIHAYLGGSLRPKSLRGQNEAVVKYNISRPTASIGSLWQGGGRLERSKLIDCVQGRPKAVHISRDAIRSTMLSPKPVVARAFCEWDDQEMVTTFIRGGWALITASHLQSSFAY